MAPNRKQKNSKHYSKCDNCPNILKKYQQLDSRITLISKENGGLSSARNKGLEACTGDYIAFIDSDDWIHRTYYILIFCISAVSDCG